MSKHLLTYREAGVDLNCNSTVLTGSKEKKRESLWSEIVLHLEPTNSHYKWLYINKWSKQWEGPCMQVVKEGIDHPKEYR